MRLIDADALKALIIRRRKEAKTLTGIDMVMVVDDAPTVDAAPVKHGQWIPVLNGIDDDTNPAFDCSECDAMYNKKHNYCPACGAKMDLEEQDAQTEQSGK